MKSWAIFNINGKYIIDQNACVTNKIEFQKKTMFFFSLSRSRYFFASCSLCPMVKGKALWSADDSKLCCVERTEWRGRKKNINNIKISSLAALLFRMVMFYKLIHMLRSFFFQFRFQMRIIIPYIRQLHLNSFLCLIRIGAKTENRVI